ncbi:unnamed protein product [Blepharisma stoltei]|uniref:Uncharacterized protein n=1 Tax=Blepharisma stoltei TaxID=1481888 RepID=A0AAU9KBR8_9CILI|nr:unnamed protein product [Blepharisma stoltei]
MIGDRYEVSVLTVELLCKENSALSCHISVGDHISGVISPINSDSDQSAVKLRRDKLIKFCVVNIETAEEIGSIEIQGSLLPTEGFQWLPLFKDQCREILSLPLKVPAPRLLVLLNTHTGLLPVHEATEHSESDSQSESISSGENDFMPELKLIQTSYTLPPDQFQEYDLESCYSALENENDLLRQEIERNQRNYFSSIMSLNYEIEEVKKKEKKTNVMNKILQEEIGEINEKLKDEIKEKEKVVKEKEEIKENFEKVKADAKAKEDSLLMILESKDSVIYKKQCEIDNLKKEVQGLKEKSESLKENGKEIEMLKQQIEELKTKLNQTENETKAENEHEELHAAVQKYLNEKNIPGLFKLIQNNKYSCGTDIYILTLKNGKIFCTKEIPIERIVASNLRINPSATYNKTPETYKTPVRGHMNQTRNYNPDGAETENSEEIFSRSSFSSEKTVSNTPELAHKRVSKRIVNVSNFTKSSVSPLREITKKDSKSFKRASFK